MESLAQAERADDQQHEDDRGRIRDPVADVAVPMQFRDVLYDLHECAEEGQALAQTRERKGRIPGASSGDVILIRRMSMSL